MSYTVKENVERLNLLPPLIVVKILSRNPAITFGVIKNYLRRKVERKREEMAEDAQLIAKYRADAQKMEQQAETLRTEPRTIQAGHCTACQKALGLPAHHFLCDHSYHPRCLLGLFFFLIRPLAPTFIIGSCLPDEDCPLCAARYQKVVDMLHSQEENHKKHELFFKQLEKSKDGYAVVADYLGKGMFPRKSSLT
ncbi:hypothetical protein Zmor_011761 [Zophobas morio]|uniref:Vacuolar protein sorting protein 11 C-terminal domain-containing protein n=1 Tax=Zophobas morio TaxID=2755281 RepID=A0AA38HI44_9CUCU|nr:hypothetical protein Zmor_011761 [Zophobas morio]